MIAEIGNEMCAITMQKFQRKQKKELEVTDHERMAEKS